MPGVSFAEQVEVFNHLVGAAVSPSLPALTACVAALPPGAAKRASETVAVYVDRAIWERWDRLWCHLLADSDDELHAFAARIGKARPCSA